MRNYELMFIVKPELEEENVNAVVEKFKTLIVNNGGEEATIDTWGKRRLAYDINDFHEGIYFLFNFKGVPETAQELDRVLKITDEILRFMIIRKEE